MKITFRIEYRTNWGEDVRLTGDAPQLGRWEADKALPLHTTDGITWQATIDLEQPADGCLHYTYCIYRNGQPVRREWDVFARTLAVDEEHSYAVADAWKNVPDQQYLYTSAFSRCLLPRSGEPLPDLRPRRSLVIKASCPRLSADYALAICGSASALGGWNTERAVVMTDATWPEWQAELDAARLEFPFEYKFVLYNRRTRRVEAWEQNPNRRVLAPDWDEADTHVVADRQAIFDLPLWRGAGVAIPVFSLRSEGSFGIGDFGDLRQMVDWAAMTHQKVVQILPINDTTMTHTWMDSYPYNGISIYALHPMYADLRQLPPLKDKAARTAMAKRQRALNALPALNYEEVDKAKWEYLRLSFEQDGTRTMVSDDYRRFFEQGREWLVPYAAYCYLREQHHTSDFREWGEYAVFDRNRVEELCMPGQPHHAEVAFHYYVQYILHRQLADASAHARKKGVVLKGDIPIGISRCSVEAWTEPHYFHMDGQAGAPPDAFSTNGQNWGFPTYDWDTMAADGYRWWMKRFQHMATYFDAYRIDHILGFFRIWEIPTHAVHGLLGRFEPALPMTTQEVESYGMTWNDERCLEPWIDDLLLEQLFGPHATRVKETYLEPLKGSEGRYALRTAYATQRQVEQAFCGKTDTDSLWIRDGLYRLISNVLFVRDDKQTGSVHPRICAQTDATYQRLPEAERQAFDRLYEHYFYHRHNDFWYEQAMRKLPVLTRATRMLVCGEDLGMIPACVGRVMDELQILSLEIQRMPKEAFQEFARLDRNPYLSVSTFSTHDMSTLRGWWKEDATHTQHFYNHLLGYYGQAPAEADAQVCETVVKQHLRGNSMLCILSWQDWLSMDEQWRNPDIEGERINIPANPRHYWRYRMHLTLEQLMKADSLNDKIRTLIDQNGRNLSC